jgi:aspartate/methionine/tyrosine aminotransferase
MPLERSLASERTRGLALSAIKDMAIRAARVPDVASLAWGLPSFRTPRHVRVALEDALRTDADAGKYTLPDGLPALREAVVETHARATGIRVSASDNVVVTAGNMEGVKAMLETVLDPGDEVIVSDPGFASHIQQIRLSGGVPVSWRLDEARGWAVDVAALASLIGPRTRAILLVTPSNPTGVIFGRADLLAVGQIAKKHNLLVILDDPYSQFCFDAGKSTFNLASVPHLSDNVAYLFTFSKCHAMSGFRLGYAIVPAELKRQMLKVHDAILICAPRPSQIAGLAALTGDQGHLAEFKRILQTRRDLICQRLDRMPHAFSYVRPEGAYYVFPRIIGGGGDSGRFAIDLLERARVCVTPGAAFGAAGEGHVRMAFCVSEDEINKAFDRLEKHFPA